MVVNEEEKNTYIVGMREELMALIESSGAKIAEKIKTIEATEEIRRIVSRIQIAEKIALIAGGKALMVEEKKLMVERERLIAEEKKELMLKEETLIAKGEVLDAEEGEIEMTEEALMTEGEILLIEEEEIEMTEEEEKRYMIEKQRECLMMKIVLKKRIDLIEVKEYMLANFRECIKNLKSFMKEKRKLGKVEREIERKAEIEVRSIKLRENASILWEIITKGREEERIILNKIEQEIKETTRKIRKLKKKSYIAVLQEASIDEEIEEIERRFSHRKPM
jgi:hypothetical protein